MMMSGLDVMGMVPMCSIKGMPGIVEVLDATIVLRSLILVAMLGLESGVCLAVCWITQPVTSVQGSST